MNERKIAEQLSKGDIKALETIINTYTGYVNTVAYNFSRGLLTKQDIEEITADAFYSLWNARKRLNAGAGVRSLLSAITRNLVKNRFRSMPPPSEDISELEIASDFLVEDAAEMSEMIKCMYKGLNKLSKDDREIFYRFYFNGEKASQIAAAKGMTTSAVEMRLSRTRSKLRKYLTERGFDHV